MPDPLNPVGAEFGDMGEIIPVKPQKEIQESDAFKKEMERKSRSVNEKEKGEKKEERQTEHQLIVEKPIIQDAVQQKQLDSILDVQKPSSDPKQAPASTTEGQTSSKKTVIAASSSDTSADLSQGNDNLTAKLPNPPLKGKGGKEDVFVQKQVAPPPLTTPKEMSGTTPAHTEKKSVAPISMESSAGHGDSSPKQKQTAPHSIPQSENPTEALKTPHPESSFKPHSTEEPKKPPLLASPHAKPLLNAPIEKGKIAAPEEKSLLSQTSTPQEKPQAQTTAPAPETGFSSEKKQEPSLSLGAPVQEPHEEPPLERPTASASPLMETPYTAEIRKDDIKASKETDEKKSEWMKIRSPSESDSLEQEKHDDEDEQKGSNQNILDQILPGSQAPLQTDGIASPFKEAIGFDRLPPHILDLFDRIIGVITVLQTLGKTETTIHLNEKQSPLLQGTQIKITTFDTAPLAYNIELKGPPQAVELLQKNVAELKRSFKDPKKEFNFQVHEIMISLTDDDEK